MLILQIALGIVLAVIILAFLPQILALGAGVIALGLGLLLLGAAILFFADNPETLIVLTGIVIVLGAGYGASETIQSKRPHLDLEGIAGALVVAALWLWMAFLAVKDQDYLGIAFVAACGIVGWFILVRWDRRAYAKWSAMNQNSNKESSSSP